MNLIIPHFVDNGTEHWKGKWFAQGNKKLVADARVETRAWFEVQLNTSTEIIYNYLQIVESSNEKILIWKHGSR